MPSSLRAARFRCAQEPWSAPLVVHATHVRGCCCAVQELRAELQAADSKDKKGIKRKVALKKVVANITMGNDSVCCLCFVLYCSPRELIQYSCSVILVYGCGTMPEFQLGRNQEEYVWSFDYEEGS
jgi:hypothetical protein